MWARRARSGLRAVLFLLIIFLSFPAWAERPVCTEIGCINGLVLKVDPDFEWRWGNYEFQFAYENRTVTCRAELPLKPCEEGPSVKCLSEGVLISESGCALPQSQHKFSDILIKGDPRRVMVRIVLNGKTLVTRSLNASYTEVRPNGPQCGPVCRSATYQLLTAE